MGLSTVCPTQATGAGSEPLDEEAFLGALRFGEQGLVAAVAQDDATGEVLMVAWMNPEAVRATIDGGEAVFFSRSRSCLWRKGGTSGNVMRVAGMAVDCDGDAVLLKVAPAGPACHTGARSCFFRRLGQKANDG